MPRSNSTTYLGNKLIKAAGINHSWTLDQMEEWQKCYSNPIYFIKNYVKIVNVDRGEILFDLWPFQEDMIKNFVRNRFNIIKCPRQVGKCLQQDACLYIRNRTTGERKYVTIKEFYEMHNTTFLSKLRNRITTYFRSSCQILRQRVSKKSANEESN